MENTCIQSATPEPDDSVPSSEAATQVTEVSDSMNCTFSTTVQQTRKSRARKPKTSVVQTVLDFSDRRMTRSVAKSKEFKSMSPLSPKPKPFRRPRAKKLKADNQASTPNIQAQPENDDTQDQAPPPTPIATLQMIGAALGVPAEKMTVEKLMASSDTAPKPVVSHDD